MEEEEDNFEAGSLYVVKIEPYFFDQKNITGQIQVDHNRTVEFFKSKLENLLKNDFRVQKKVKRLHRLQSQLSLLINKSIDGKYGLSQDTFKVSLNSLNRLDSISSPLPPIDKGNLSEFLKILYSKSPIELQKYISKSGIIEQLIFSDSSIFNYHLLDSFLRAPPDNQISFIVYCLEQIRVCSKLYYKILSVIHQYSFEDSLRSQLLSPNSNISNFFAFYDKSLKQIAEICKSDDCKIVYCSNESQQLLFQTPNFISVILANDSLSGVLIKKLNSSRIEYPRREKSFEAITEGSLFNRDDPILSIPIGIDHNSVLGLLILTRQSSKFSIIDEIVSSKITEYLTPILLLFRSIFVQINPSQYNQLFQCVSSIRSTEKPLINLIKEQFCILTSATFCKVYVNDSESIDYPEFPQLPQDSSLVRKVLESKSITTYQNPRSHADFNKKVDDEPSLSKITSILIVPVKNSPVVIVLYNPTNSSEFTEKQKLLASHLSLSLQPLLMKLSIRHQRERLKGSSEEKAQSLSSLIDCLRNSVINLNSAKFVESVQSFLPEGIEARIYFFLTSEKAFKLPEHEVIQVPQKLLEIKEDVVVRGKPENGSFKDFDLDEEVKFLSVIPITETDHKVVFTFSSKDESVVKDDDALFCAKFGRILLPLIQPYVYNYQVREISERSRLVDGATHLSAQSISRFVGTNVECHFFSPPVSEEPRLNKPLSIMVETPKGIEAALTSDVSIKSENERKALVSFAELMSSVLTAKKCHLKELPEECVSFFIDYGILDVFGCADSKFKEWIASVFTIYTDAGIDPMKKFASAKFVSKMIVAKKWENMFSKEEKIVIILIVFLNEIKKCWRCAVDDQLVSIFNELKCRPVSGLFCSILFGSGFGIAGDKIDLETKKLLISTVNDFAVEESSHDYADVSSHVRLISLHSFKQSMMAKVWIGRALVLISSLQEIAESDEAVIGQIASEMNEMEKKKIIFKIERVFVPMLSYILQRNEPITQIMENIRNSLKILHGTKST